MKRCRVIPALVALVVLLAAPALRAAPLDDRIPKDAVIYAGWRGTDALGAEYAQSNLKGVVDSAGLGNYLQEQLPHWIDMAGQRNPDAPDQINDLLTALGILWHHPVAVYAGPLDFTQNPSEPKVRFAVLCDAGADAQALLDLLQKAVTKNPVPPDANLNITREGNVIIVTAGASTAAQFAVHADALNSSPVYLAALKRINPNSALTAFIDSPAIIASVEGGFAGDPTIPPEDRKKEDAVMKALGLRGLGQIVYGGGFENKGWVETAFIGANAPRTGVLSLLDTGPFDDASLAAVPNEAVAFNGARFDLMKTLATTRDILGQIDPSVLQNFNQGLEDAGHQLGLDIEKDLFATLGDHWIMYRAPSPDGVGLVQSFVMKVKDGGTLANTAKVIEAQVIEKGGGKVQIEDADVDGISVTELHMPMVTVAWTVRNDYLYVSSLSGISAAVNQVEKKQPSILTNQTYLTARGLLPKEPVNAIDYADPSKIYPELYRSAAMLLPFLSAAGINVPVQILPNPIKAAPFLTPGASESWTDDEGFHFKSITAMPGAGLLAGQQSGGTAVAAFGAAVTLPTLGKSRELSNRSADAANVRGIAQSCNVFAADNADHLPDNLSILLVKNYISPKQLVTHRSGTKPLPFTQDDLDKAKTDPDTFAKSVEDHCDYIYLGEGLVNQTDSGIVLLFEKPGPATTDGINIGFEDGHAEFIRWNGLADAFKATNDLLRKNGKAEVDVDALLKAAPGRH